MNEKLTIGFMGAGNMASAMIAGLRARGFPAKQLMACARTEKKLMDLQKSQGIAITTNACDVIGFADVLILATKPKDFTSLFSNELLALLQSKQPLIISVMAGMQLNTIEENLKTSVSIVRCMPNIAATIQSSMTGLYANTKTTLKQKETADFIMQCIGKIIWLDQEQQLEAFTALCGSGPAYFFLLFEALSQGATKSSFLRHPQDNEALSVFIECLEKAAMQLPISLPDYHQLVLQTALGSLQLAKASPLDFIVLRESVTSKGGTTEAALKVLFEGNMKGYFQAPTEFNSVEIGKITELLIRALHQAYLRAIEIGDLYSSS